MRRRQILAAGISFLSVSLAGCALPSNTMRIEKSTPLKIVEEVSMEVDTDEKEYEILRSAIENKTATRTGQNKWFDRRDTVLLNQTVYTVNETRLSSEKATTYRVGVDFTPENTNPELGVIRYDKLPPRDRRRLNRTLRSGSTDKVPGELEVEYEPTGRGNNTSVFIPDQQYDILQYKGEQYRVGVEREFSSAVDYQYEVIEIAASVEPFAEQLRDMHLFTLNDLSPGEREVIEEAIETGEVAWESEDSASVISKIREHTALSQDDYGGSWLMKYDGSEYLVHLRWS